MEVNQIENTFVSGDSHRNEKSCSADILKLDRQNSNIPQATRGRPSCSEIGPSPPEPVDSAGERDCREDGGGGYHQPVDLVAAIDETMKRICETDTQLLRSLNNRHRLQNRLKDLEDTMLMWGQISIDELRRLVPSQPSEKDVNILNKLYNMAKEKAARLRVIKSLELKEKAIQESLIFSDDVFHNADV